jgi:hypothetical protein
MRPQGLPNCPPFNLASRTPRHSNGRRPGIGLERWVVMEVLTGSAFASYEYNDPDSRSMRMVGRRQRPAKSPSMTLSGCRPTSALRWFNIAAPRSSRLARPTPADWAVHLQTGFRRSLCAANARAFLRVQRGESRMDDCRRSPGGVRPHSQCSRSRASFHWQRRRLRLP